MDGYSSGYIAGPNMNVMDAQSMPSPRAQAARERAAEIMAAMKAKDMEKASALLAKDESSSKAPSGMSWMKRKLNKRNQSKLEGKEVDEVDEVEVLDKGASMFKKEKKGDVVIR